MSNAKSNGQIIGKIDEVFGKQSQSYFSVTPEVGVKLNGFSKGDKVYLDKAFILPLSYIINCEKPKPKIQKPRTEGGEQQPRTFNKGGFNNQNRGNFNRGNFNKGNFNKGNFNRGNQRN